jgi:hypothetical protein
MHILGQIANQKISRSPWLSLTATPNIAWVSCGVQPSCSITSQQISSITSQLRKAHCRQLFCNLTCRSSEYLLRGHRKSCSSGFLQLFHQFHETTKISTRSCFYSLSCFNWGGPMRWWILVLFALYYSFYHPLFFFCIYQNVQKYKKLVVKIL